MNILTKLGSYAIALIALWGAWQWHGDSEYKRGRAELAAEVNAKGKEVEAARAALEKAKQDLVAQAATQEKVKAAELEKIREAIKTLDNDRSRTINGLRSTLATYTNEVRPATGSACELEILRRQASDRLLLEGQRLAVEGAGLLDASVGVVGQCEVALRQQAIVLQAAKQWAVAVELKE